MKTATLKELKSELTTLTSSELLNICLELSKFKKENKELMTYLLFESKDEDTFIQNVQTEIKEQFLDINTSSYFYIKKSTRKILKKTKTHIRYSKSKVTEIELLLCFCQQMSKIHPSIKGNLPLYNIFNREKIAIEKKLLNLHDDLRHDYSIELNSIIQAVI